MDSGPVYGYSGYSAPGVYGSPVYYGDIRLQVQPRDAQVYVDGYYSGIVDDFDGVFQRLTLEVGPHHIELAAPGLDSARVRGLRGPGPDRRPSGPTCSGKRPGREDSRRSSAHLHHGLARTSAGPRCFPAAPTPARTVSPPCNLCPPSE